MGHGHSLSDLYVARWPGGDNVSDGLMVCLDKLIIGQVLGMEHCVKGEPTPIAQPS